MAGQGRINVNSIKAVGDIQSTHQYDVDVRFDIAFDFGGYNADGASYSITCDGQTKTGTATFNIASGNGNYIWGNIGGTKTFRITMPTSGSSKKISLSANINTGINPSTITASNSYTLPAVIWEYTLTFDPNGGELLNPGENLYNGTNDDTVTVTYGTGNYHAMSGDIPVRTGYSFNGWYTENTNGVQVYDSEGQSIPETSYWNSNNKWIYKNNLTVYAQWTPNTYEIRYDANGGTNAPDLQLKTHDTNLTLSTSKPTRTGYTFLGWSIDSSSSIADYVEGAEYTQEGNAVLYAVWRVHQLTVNYYSNYATNYNGTNDILNTVNNNNVLIYSQKFNYDVAYEYGLCDYSYSGSSLYLIKTGYFTSEYWGTTTSGGVLIKQDLAFGSGQELAEFFGKSLKTEDVSIDVYAQWEPANIAYLKSNDAFKLCYVYYKVKDVWKQVIVHIKSNDSWWRSIV